MLYFMLKIIEKNKEDIKESLGYFNVGKCEREVFGKNTPGSDNGFEVPRHQSSDTPHTTL